MHELTCLGCATQNSHGHKSGRPTRAYRCPDCGYRWSESQAWMWEIRLLEFAQMVLIVASGWFAAEAGLGLIEAAIVILSVVGVTELVRTVAGAVEDILDPPDIAYRAT